MNLDLYEVFIFMNELVIALLVNNFQVCVCVCVCGYERERQRQREVAQSLVFKEL